MFQDMKEEMGIEGEVGADTVTREMKIVMIIKDMSMIWNYFTEAFQWTLQMISF